MYNIYETLTYIEIYFLNNFFNSTEKYKTATKKALKSISTLIFTTVRVNIKKYLKFFKFDENLVNFIVLVFERNWLN